MVLANTEGVDTCLFGEYTLSHDIAQGLRLRHRAAVVVEYDVAKRIQTELDHHFSMTRSYVERIPAGLLRCAVAPSAVR